MIGPIDLIFAFFLDLAIGDPRWLPHPVRIIGRGIISLENSLRKNFEQTHEKAAGLLLVVAIVLPVMLITYLIHKALLWTSANLFMFISMVILIYLVSTTLALRELINSARLVIEAVRDRSIEAARGKLSMIVGRDTKDLSEDRILMATIETLAENLSDGMIAPLFYLVIGGLPLAMAYKAINTLDSMVGYKNERYINFGWAAARLDDIANYIPARITGMLTVIASLILTRSLSTAHHSLKTMLRDGRKHSSPNSGIPEAAMAGALGIRLGGPSSYNGVLVDKPYIGDNHSDNYILASSQAITIVKISSVLGVAISVLILTIRTIA